MPLSQIWLTPRLWRSLHQPNFASPIWRRVYFSAPVIPWRVFKLPFTGVFARFTLIILPILFIFIGMPVLVTLFFLVMALTPLVVPLAITTFASALAFLIAGAVSAEQEHSTYDLLAASPIGRLGVHWSFCTGWLFRLGFWEWLTVGMVCLGCLATFFGLAVPLIFQPAEITLIDPLVRTAAAIGFFIVDFASAVCIGALVGVLAPAWNTVRFNAGQIAIGAVLLIQTATYAATGLLMTLRPVPPTLQPLLAILFLAVQRELLIRALAAAVTGEFGDTLALDGESASAL